uniref:Uncharacterized protein n=1 Tax=Romanomermis culicivorax TaxID=13658 RepID=A0A915J850_ROMCU
MSASPTRIQNAVRPTYYCQFYRNLDYNA